VVSGRDTAIRHPGARVASRTGADPFSFSHGVLSAATLRDGLSTQVNVGGVEEDGFVTLHRLRKWASEHSVQEWEATYPAHALLLGLSDELRNSGSGARSSEAGMLTLNQSSLDYLKYVAKVGFLTKRPGNPFPRIISLGRTSSNDVVIDVRSVSKLHGHFESREGDWTFSDNDSTSGSWLNGAKLEPKHAYPLKSGDALRFGPDMEAVFLTPSALYSRARGK